MGLGEPGGTCVSSDISLYEYINHTYIFKISQKGKYFIVFSSELLPKLH